MGKSPAKRVARPRSMLRKVSSAGAVKGKPDHQQPAVAAEPAPTAGAAPKPNRPPTAFESRLYAVCKCIPAGRVTTYGAMAEVLDSAPRACGQALRRNPFAPAVPCHRVIAASLELGGFSGSWGVGCATVQKKKKLLGEEGVHFDEAGRLKPESRAAVMNAAQLRQAAAHVL